MSAEINKVPYREGVPPPGPGCVLVQMADTTGNDEGMWWVLPTNQKDGAVQYKDMEPFRPMLHWVWKHLREHLSWCRSFEDWELGFMRNANPGPEATIWARHTYAYLEFVHKNPAVIKAGVFGAIMSLMNGREDQIDPPSVAQKLKRLASNPPVALESAQNFTKDGRLKTKEKHLR